MLTQLHGKTPKGEPVVWTLVGALHTLVHHAMRMCSDKTLHVYHRGAWLIQFEREEDGFDLDAVFEFDGYTINRYKTKA